MPKVFCKKKELCFFTDLSHNCQFTSNFDDIDASQHLVPFCHIILTTAYKVCASKAEKLPESPTKLSSAAQNDHKSWKRNA